MQEVTEEMLVEAADAVKVAAGQMLSNDYPREPTGGDEAAMTTTCTRCDLAGICGTWQYR